MSRLAHIATIVALALASGCGSDSGPSESPPPAAPAGGFELVGAENLSLTAQCDCAASSSVELTVQNLWANEMGFVVKQTAGDPLPDWMSMKVTTDGTVVANGTAKITISGGSTSAKSCCAATAFQQDLSFTITPVKDASPLEENQLVFTVHVDAPRKPKLSVPTDPMKLSCLVLSNGELANCSQTTLAVKNTGDGRACVKTSGCAASDDLKKCIASGGPDDFTLEPGASETLHFMASNDASPYTNGTIELKTSCETITVPVELKYDPM